MECFHGCWLTPRKISDEKELYEIFKNLWTVGCRNLEFRARLEPWAYEVGRHGWVIPGFILYLEEPRWSINIVKLSWEAKLGSQAV